MKICKNLIYLSMESIWIMDLGWWILSFKVKFKDFRILFRYSEQVFGNWLLPVTIWLFGSGYTLCLRVWGVKWPSRPWSGSWGVTWNMERKFLLSLLGVLRWWIGRNLWSSPLIAPFHDWTLSHCLSPTLCSSQVGLWPFIKTYVSGQDESLPSAHLDIV